MKEVSPDDKWNDEGGSQDYESRIGQYERQARELEEQYRQLLEEQSVEDDDPFSDGNREIINTITLLRIYDALMAQLTAVDRNAGRKLFELHSNGGLMGPSPKFNPELLNDSESPPAQE